MKYWADIRLACSANFEQELEYLQDWSQTIDMGFNRNRHSKTDPTFLGTSMLLTYWSS